jgi:ATP-dependent helicase/nuclease subunit B
MKRYHITVDRLSAGALASTATGSLWRSLITAIANPERQLSLRSLLHHPLLGIEAALLQGLEKGWHGISRRYAGQLPPHEKALATHPQYTPLAVLIKDIQQLSGQQHSASGWVEACRELIAPWIAQSAQGHEAVEKALEALPYADSFGVMPIEDFSALLLDALSAPWRDAGLNTHPRIHFLTPVEARLQQFDRVILASMTDDIWPGKTPANPWLNLAAQQSLGFPDAAEQVSLMAHDMLMLASGSEVFLTYAQRVGGSPAAPSRFVERFLTLLESHGVQPATIDARIHPRSPNSASPFGG